MPCCISFKPHSRALSNSVRIFRFYFLKNRAKKREVRSVHSSKQLVVAGSNNARAMKVGARDGSSCCSFRASLKGNPGGLGCFVFGVVW